MLSQADFAMSKIAANEEFDGNTLRKAIDYFCHLAVAPEFYPQIESNDIIDQCETGKAQYGVITDIEEFKSNLDANCLPLEIKSYEFEAYEQFLQARRLKMAAKIKSYYFAL